MNFSMWLELKKGGIGRQTDKIWHKTEINSDMKCHANIRFCLEFYLCKTSIQTPSDEIRVAARLSERVLKEQTYTFKETELP